MSAVETRFAERILDVDQAIADRWGCLGILDPVPDIDELLAVTALEHDLVVVTRNVKHIVPTGARYFNPLEQHLTH